MLTRKDYIQHIHRLYKTHPIVALLGPRQCGKTTLARMYATETQDNVHFFDLEDETDVVSLANPKLALSNLSGLIVLDEIQLRPELFPTLRVLADQHRHKQRYLILGSASRDLIQQSSESLAGRVAYVELNPLSVFEIDSPERLWLRGGFPVSYLADTDRESLDWRKNYVRTFLERDIPALGLRIEPNSLRRFWNLLAHYHANLINFSELARSFGLSHTTIHRYLDILSGTFMVRQLQPWFANISKRQVKAPKIYLRDSGLLHTLLDLPDYATLQRHPKVGASWEGFALEQIIYYHQAEPEECYFWATHAQAELDLLIVKGDKREGFEFKYMDAPKMTKSMHIALQDLELTQLTIIYPGTRCYSLAENVTVRNLSYFIHQHLG